MNTRIALLLAVVLGVVAALAANVWVTNERTLLQNEKRNIMVIAAARRLGKGSVISRDDLVPKEFPARELAAGMITYSESEARRITGRMLDRGLEPGEVIFTQFLTADDPRRGTRQSVVTPGKVAITLRVDAVSSHQYMIRPGDYVDILGHFNVENLEWGTNKAPAGLQPLDDPDAAKKRPAPPKPAVDPSAVVAPPGASRTMATVLLAEAVQVLAVDNQTAARAVGQRDGFRYNTITLELDHKNAYRLYDAQMRGSQLFFPLRSVGDITRQYDGQPAYVNVGDIYYQEEEAKTPEDPFSMKSFVP